VKKIPIFIFIYNLTLTTKIHGNYLSGLTISKNTGEHIFETGNKYPNLSGIRGGSRITYNRDFYLGGLEFHYLKTKYSIGINFQTTGWYVHTEKMSRDEDFLMGQISTERGKKFSLFPLFLYDTAHTFTGTQNFADGIGKSVVSQNTTDLNFKYYLGKATTDIWESQDGLFLSSSIKHTFFKYYLYDVTQFVNRPFYYGPIGLGLSYTFASLEFAFGLGYFFNFGKVKLETSTHLLFGYLKYRDFHIQRALNFKGIGSGIGFLLQINLLYQLTEVDMIRVGYKAHRLFSESNFKTFGGLTREDVLSNYYGKYHSYITTKEAALEFSFLRKINYSK